VNHISLFLNTKIEGSGVLAEIGDRGLTPFRYLFNGQTVRINPKDHSREVEIHHVASFHEDGKWHYSRTAGINLVSSPTSKFRAVVSVALLIPGLALSVFKLLAYFFSEMRQRHNLAKEHFTPINREIGTVDHPITTIEALKQALTVEQNKPKHQPTHALIIHGDGNLAINEDPGILQLNPMKLVLDGAKIVHMPSVEGRLDDAMEKTGKWNGYTIRTVTAANVDAAVQEALEVTAPLRGGFSYKRYHQIFTLNRPQQVPARM
jgi:hypothetical protein